ncbi:hypothetical protein SAPIO_CDS6033 [Scedosporium apiospermum]|uniref:lytic cellulose monooxygenase (C4-dehydrogenating) n=1 Tax=Pseudallescheria apiosperma TaxID=563466 RepID=A0A084G5Y5_PSEDA|nr:uncharacterized protein SAPIO_CDS6033 [Scedosporium apiospermum]KEZ42747.1 hypothetical protein SAPIO_CDS6033 [Scedosporium apiospermum]
MARSLAIPAGLASLLLLAVRVDAHGIADGLAVYPGGAAGGTYYRGYNPSFQYEKPPPEVAEWSTPQNLQNGFVAPAAYNTPDIICHLGATPGAVAIPVNAGDELGIHWDTWPDSHKGPIVDSLANCEGACQNVDKTKLKFFDISREAVINAASDLWAPNVLIKNDLTWFVKIPESIAPGNYVLRHEIVALHAAGQPNGAQSYPFCFNLAISSKGTDHPEGRTFEGYYSQNEVGIVWDLFGKSAADYKIPGPADNLYSKAEVASQRKPSITATGTFVKSLDLAALPKETSSAEEEASTSEAAASNTEVAEETPASPTNAGTTTDSVQVNPPSPTAATSEKESTPAASSEEAPSQTSESPVSSSEAPASNSIAAAVVYSTVYITHRVTVTQVDTTTLFATVTLPRP